MASANPATIKIMRPGIFQSADGRTYAYSSYDLKRMAEVYDGGRCSAPLVLGHPTDDRPAYGRVASLSFDGEFLRARPVGVSPVLQQHVAAGRYKRVSASFHAPGAAQNPTPGVWHLKHVGFLGAMHPAVKGLGNVSFAEAPGTVATFDMKNEEAAIDGFVAPHGYSVDRSQAELYGRAAAMITANPKMHWSDAVYRAGEQKALERLIGDITDPAERARIEIVIQAWQLRAANPRLSFQAALEQARTNAAIANFRNATPSNRTGA